MKIAIFISISLYLSFTIDANTTINLDATLDLIKEHYANADSYVLHSKFIIPILRSRNYDQNVLPLANTGHPLDVKIGIQILSISDFKLATMDFNINIWLKMAYYDPRLAHNSGSIILVNDYHVLQKLYRPSIFFINSRARFHDVTYRNAYMLIFENGVVFYEVGLFLQPSCQMYLRQYPFDSSSCNLRISSNSYTNDSLRFSWFAKDEDAVQMSKDIQLPDFYIRSHAFSKCDGRRKTGNYSCVEFKLNLKRNIYYHFARTYVPVTMCVILSWIGVFLPTEFVEGRIFCSLTVFLTLSAESTTAKELIPKLSYLTAIGIWFGVLSIFVFLTVLQALVVITLEYKSRALDQKLSISNMFADKNKFDEMTRKKIYCHRLAIKLDKTCRILYPLMFIIFLFVYYFIIISRDDGNSLAYT